MLDHATLGEIVNRNAIAHGLRPDIVMCIVIQESGCDTFSNRFEPRFYEHLIFPKTREQLAGFVPALNALPNLATEKVNRSTSWGLMQVMGDTARWCAKITSPYLTVLLDPERGVDAGCRVLSYYLGKNDKNYTQALAAYNAGNPASAAGQLYAKSVLARVARGEYTSYLKGN